MKNFKSEKTINRNIKYGILTLSVLLYSLLIFPPLPIIATGNIYYVSNSEGNDKNDGSMKAPWKSINKISSMTFKPGDKILLKKGDVWTHQVLYLRGNGTSKNGIILSSYGTSKLLPVIKNPAFDIDTRFATNNNKATVGIKIDTYSGWKIGGIEISNAMFGIVFFNKSNTTVDGLSIENCYIHDIDGFPIPLQNFSNIKSNLPPYMSQGILITGGGHGNNNQDWLKNLTISNTIINNCEATANIKRINGRMMIDGLESDNSHRAGLLIEECNFTDKFRGIIQNCKITNVGKKQGMFWGTAGIQFNVGVNITLQDSEIAFTQNNDFGHDAVGVDYEASNINILTQRCYIHDNSGSAFLIYKNPTWGTDNKNSQIRDNLIENNGLSNTDTTPAFLRHYFNQKNGGIISGNRIIKADAKQFLNYIDELFPATTESMPKSYTIGSNSISVRNNIKTKK